MMKMDSTQNYISLIIKYINNKTTNLVDTI